MYIAPNTQITLLKNIPLTADYSETFYWESDTARQQYLYNALAHSPRTYTAQSYQRKDRDYIRIEAKYADVYMYNYLTFKNKSHEGLSTGANRTFYAFITNVVYINENVVEIEYQIDVIQTWFFDMSFKPCFVERQHTLTDGIGDNLVPENLNLGEYIVDTPQTSGHMTNYSTVVASMLDSEYQDAVGRMYTNVYSGLNFIPFRTYLQNTPDVDPSTQQPYLDTEINLLIDYLEQAVHDQGAEAIQSIFTMPDDFIPSTQRRNNQTSDTYGATQQQVYISWKPSVTSSSIDGYSPVRNKKLFTYPYYFLYVSTPSGNNAVFPYEYFEYSNTQGHLTDIMFNMYGNFCPNPEVKLVPANYKGANYNYAEALKIKAGTQCAWSCNSYEAWQAYTASYLPGLVGSAAEVAFGSPSVKAMGGLSLVHQVSNMMGEMVKASIDPRQAKGNSDGNIDISAGQNDFYFWNKHIRAEFAEKIDSYFSRFGYAINAIQTPNIHAREKWTFIKTIDCNIEGDIPANDLIEIRKIFDNGIAFWADVANFGNYLLANNVLPAPTPST